MIDKRGVLRIRQNAGLLFLLLVTSLPCPLLSQTTFSLVELNTENFFDCWHDEGKDDKDFLPNGARRWNKIRFWKKLVNISKELMACTPSKPPALIALTEIENDSVLQYLTKRSPLRRIGYEYAITNSKDERGIDVALLYLPEIFKLISIEKLSATNEKGVTLRTRNVLKVSGRIFNDDTLHLYVCHLPSQLGGKKALRKRKRMMEIIRNSICQLQEFSPEAPIVIIGDFNCVPQSKVLIKTLGIIPFPNNEAPSPQRFYNLSANYKPSNDISGTYKFDGRWEMIDQCIVSGSLLSGTASLSVSKESFRICCPDFLLEPDAEDLGKCPFRTYRGFRYCGGFSDHLPICVDFKVKEKGKR